ncbi:aspartate-semialdehyde dehydrogenase [candidate division KSB1 bacterium]|nr:aspartate-semialdehyde dehydrogenase [candidate division KSB1 bacterium]
MKPLALAVVGATGLVGRTTLDVLREWQLPVASLRLFASGASSGKSLSWCERGLALEELREVPDGLDAAIFCTNREISRAWIPRFRERRVPCIDHSSEYRMDPDVPLVIPEINSYALRGHRNLISNPNCSASVVLLPLAALDRAVGLKRVIVSTYQSVSGTGQDAMAELAAELMDHAIQPRVYPRQIAHNVFPQVGPFGDDGNCEEERKVIEEIRKILERPGLEVMATTVRVPVRVGHSASVAVELTHPANRADIECAFGEMAGMIYETADYRSPLEIVGKQEMFVSRLRAGDAGGVWWNFWVVGDNLRKGAASNAIQILRELFK